MFVEGCERWRGGAEEFLVGFTELVELLEVVWRGLVGVGCLGGFSAFFSFLFEFSFFVFEEASKDLLLAFDGFLFSAMG